jgi:hypothetical protein
MTHLLKKVDIQTWASLIAAEVASAGHLHAIFHHLPGMPDDKIDELTTQLVAVYHDNEDDIRAIKSDAAAEAMINDLGPVGALLAAMMGKRPS